MKLTYSARFTVATVTRSSHHAYKTAAIAVKDGVAYANATFSAGVARPVMPGDPMRRSSRAMCYSSNERAKMRKEADEADKGWVVEVVPVQIN